jgi:hypothetical protein
VTAVRQLRSPRTLARALVDPRVVSIETRCVFNADGDGANVLRHSVHRRQMAIAQRRASRAPSPPWINIPPLGGRAYAAAWTTITPRSGSQQGRR